MESSSKADTPGMSQPFTSAGAESQTYKQLLTLLIVVSA